MGQKTDKITKHNLGPRILHLMTQEGKNSVEIRPGFLPKRGFKIFPAHYFPLDYP